MKIWPLLFLTLICVACTDSSTDDPATLSDEQPTPMETPPGQAQPAPAATTPDTDTATGEDTTWNGDGAATDPDIVTEEIEYTVDGEPFTGYIAYDGRIEGKRPGVLVVHEWWGHDDYARSRAEQLAAMGYTAFALDMYGAGKVADHPDNAQQFMEEATKDPEQVQTRFLAAKQLLEQHATTDPDQIAAIGYCFGGGVVLNMALAGVDLDGVASFHGSLATMVEPQPDEITAQMLILHGEDDPMIPQEQVETFKSELETAGADYEFISYPGATHSFTNPDATEVGEKYDMPLAYDKEADEKSWNELKEFLASLWPEES